ncbi:type II toxin-antitoxin system RelB family antitoxin [Desulfonatronovibrio magnus]|uniref:type II toxin-antitoxin system RelB family antitoxin n=1 Tax=Desulfonatronovibrio magnus TaxID=698827 RepID=UPI0006965D93|nr:DUF6290 family protein [Desulfonatronovibrio magnus]
MPTSVRLPEEYEQRLNFLAKHTGMSKSFFIKKVIMDHIEDLEDIYLAEHRLKELHQGRDKVLNSEEFWSGLDD